MARTAAEFERVKQLMTHGLTDHAIATLTGIPREPIRTWRLREQPPRRMTCGVRWRVPEGKPYCYLLGCYLGDGHVTRRSSPPRTNPGLIHTDGCRAVNRFRTKLPSGRVAEYSYVRYFFSNLSEDIREIFVEHCRLLGIRVTQSNRRNLSIAHRDSVALLEQIVGVKT